MQIFIKDNLNVSARTDACEMDLVFDKKETSFQQGTYQTTYMNPKLSAVAESVPYAEGRVLRQHVTYTAQAPLMLTRATVANVQGVCLQEDGIASRLNDGSIMIHYCISRWQGEGQWRHATPEYLGIYPATEHEWEKAWWRLQSISSWSTGAYYPIVIIEDKQQGKAWFFTLECGRSWFFEVYGVGGRSGMKSLSVAFGGADEPLGFAKKMNAGDIYQSADGAYGVVQGGFEEAIQTLVAYWRESSLVPGGSPLVFNDYMNCNWTNETPETLIPLIDRAAEMGCEVFCLDDGWEQKQGTWFPAEEKFGENGIASIFDHIREKGMQIGVWFEFETLRAGAEQLIGADDCFLFRNGAMIAPERPLANFRSEKLLAYLYERVDAMYKMGVRFIKNDHNNTEQIGTTLYGESPAEGLEKNEQAFLAFIDGLRARYPDLIIENCASGAMRSDAGTLRHFHIQSTSDQEDYLLYPSVLAGSLALMPPEKAGIWCYPYPLVFEDRLNLKLSDEQVAQFADGEQTVFNVVNGFMGNLYLSGKIHQADAYNTALLKEGLDLYLAWRGKIFESVPIFPCGMISLSARTPYAVGLLHEKTQSILLAVWNLSSEATSFAVDLRRYNLPECAIVYPCKQAGVTYTYTQGLLQVSFERGQVARLFQLH
ncbi:MAG: alpha-galactosidase [Clostridia bacterium]|nr:alpha-galactosidase [Clostridia bacterium]